MTDTGALSDVNLYGGAPKLTVLVPLMDKARQYIGRRIKVHIVGGMVVGGKLRAVDDDCTITVVDRQDTYEIALQSVAVLETNERH